MQQILEIYKETKSTVKTALRLKLTYRYVNKYLKSNGIELKVGNLNKYTFNKNFFQETNILNSYWAGFIAGDGHLSRNEVIISISEKDKNHLLNFKNDINFSGDIKYYTHTLGYTNNYKYGRIRIASKQICSNLTDNYGITKNKTWNLKFPSHLSEDILFSYILGYIDADGAFCRNNGILKSLNISGTYEYLKNMQHFICSYLDVDNEGIKIYPDHTIYRIMISRKNILLRIRDIVETRFTNLPLMKRKWDILKKANLNRGRK